jgi:tetratricopeptide (TPR) repeat protein
MTMTRVLQTSLAVAVAFAACAATNAGAQPPVPMTPMAPPTPIAPRAPMARVTPMAPVAPTAPVASSEWGPTLDDRADDLYSEGREAIEEGRYDRAVERFNRLIDLKSSRTDAALYWKAYSQAKLAQRADALNTLADLQKRFADSRWIKDAKALDVELRQASGQTVSPASQQDDELKLMALRGIMQSNPDEAFPTLEKMLNSTNSPKVKDRALFVLSQSRSAKAREIIEGVARGNANPDLQLKAIHYIGMMNGAENRQVLSDIYKGSSDPAVKRAILRSYMMAGDRERLLTLARTETDAGLRSEAVRQLGMMHGGTELTQLYQSESSPEVKKQILQAMFVSGDADKLIELARSEPDAELRKTAIRDLGLMKRQGTTEALTGIYASDATVDVRKAVVNALFLQNNAAALVTLARGEKNPDLKKEIVSRLSMMKSKEATDYLMELLK